MKQDEADPVIATIHQPQFIPWAGYFYKILKSDVFVLYDNVQFPRGKHFGNRNMIKTTNGPLWLTVPVLGKSEMLPYNRIAVDPSAIWKNKHAKTLELSYKHAPYYSMIVPQMVELYQRSDWQSIAELDEVFLRLCLATMNWTGRMIRGSEIESTKGESRGDDAIISILKEVGADTYISGKGEGSRRYVDAPRFEQEKIQLLSYDFAIPPYPQGKGDFVPDLSVIDLIAHTGNDANSMIERSGALTGWISA